MVAPDSVTLPEQPEAGVGALLAVTDLMNASFSIPKAGESQGQSAFSWEGQQCVFLCCLRDTSTAPCLVRGLWLRTWRNAACPQKWELSHYVGDTLLTAPTEQDVGEAWGSVLGTMREHCVVG